MPKTITLLTDKGMREVSFNHQKQLWYYKDDNTEVEKIHYPKLSLSFSDNDEYYNVSLLSRITNTPASFWRSIDDDTKSFISQVLGRAYDSVKDELLELREKRMEEKKQNTIKKMVANNPKYKKN